MFDSNTIYLRAEGHNFKDQRIVIRFFFIVEDINYRSSFDSKIEVVTQIDKYDEFSFLYQNNYRGNAHHKQFFDVVEDTLIVYPIWMQIKTSMLVTKPFQI